MKQNKNNNNFRLNCFFFAGERKKMFKKIYSQGNNLNLKIKLKNNPKYNELCYKNKQATIKGKIRLFSFFQVEEDGNQENF